MKTPIKDKSKKSKDKTNKNLQSTGKLPVCYCIVLYWFRFYFVFFWAPGCIQKNKKAREKITFAESLIVCNVFRFCARIMTLYKMFGLIFRINQRRSVVDRQVDHLLNRINQQ